VAKDSPRITDEELQRLVQKKKKIKNNHHILFGRFSENILLARPKTNSSIFSCQTRLDLQLGPGSMVR